MAVKNTFLLLLSQVIWQYIEHFHRKWLEWAYSQKKKPQAALLLVI